MRFEIDFYGHKNIRSLHQKTIEITKDSELTPRGDCIIGVNASCSCDNLPTELKAKIKDPSAIIQITILVNDKTFYVMGNGSEDLTLDHPTDIVIRTSSYTCPRTLAINCNAASNSIPREMIESLQNPNTKGKFIISIQE